MGIKAGKKREKKKRISGPLQSCGISIDIIYRF